MSLFFRSDAERKACCGHISYLHSQLLEREAKQNGRLIYRSSSELPVIKTQAGDVTKDSKQPQLFGINQFINFASYRQNFMSGSSRDVAHLRFLSRYYHKDTNFPEFFLVKLSSIDMNNVKQAKKATEQEAKEFNFKIKTMIVPLPKLVEVDIPTKGRGAKREVRNMYSKHIGVLAHPGKIFHFATELSRKVKDVEIKIYSKDILIFHKNKDD